MFLLFQQGLFRFQLSSSRRKKHAQKPPGIYYSKPQNLPLLKKWKKPPKKRKNTTPTPMLCDLFGMVICVPFKWLLVTSNVWGWKGHKESPGVSQLQVQGIQGTRLWRCLSISHRLSHMPQRSFFSKISQGVIPENSALINYSWGR